jgi:hypothetical protein
MSADRRKKILIVFAGLAIVLVGVIAYVSPNFRNDHVSGAIGAVQKHRQPQIAQQDVILGDETARREQEVLYGEFLSDAGSLRSAAIDIALAARAADAKARLAAEAQELAAAADDLQAQYAAEAKKTLGIIAILIGSESLERKKVEAGIQELGRMVEARKLSAADMEQFNARLAAMLGSYSFGEGKLGARLQSSEELLAAIRRSDENLAAARLALKEIEARIAARSTAAMLRAEESYLQAMSQEAKSVESAKRSIEALAAEPVNEYASRADAISAALAHQAGQLEARAMKNMEMLASGFTFGKGQEKWIRGHAVDLSSLENELAARKTGSEAEMVAFRADISALAKKLESEADAVAARTAAHAQAQLRMIGEQLNAQEAMNARLASIDSQLAAQLRNHEALMAYSQHLEAMSRTGSEAALASMLGSHDFAAEAKKLHGKAVELQARKQ